MNVDSSNNSLPSKHPVIVSVPALPTCYVHTGGGGGDRKKHHRQRCSFTGTVGRLHSTIPAVVYTSNKNVVCRTLPIITISSIDGVTTETTTTVLADLPILPTIHPTLTAFVYRGHTSNVTAIAVSKSGAYIASGDEKGSYRVWSYDHMDHLCKYSLNSFFSGPIHDLDWDAESKRIVICGERSPSDTMTGVNTKVVQWDTGVSIVHTTNTGMAIHLPRGRATSCSFKSSRPFRVVTSGMEDGKVALHSGPPFTKVPVVSSSSSSSSSSTTTTTNGTNHETIPMETGHKTGSTIHAVRYHPDGTYVVSVGSDKSICLYDGTTLALLQKVDLIHDATIYDVAWSSSSSLLTASGDGSCKLFSVSVGTPPTLQETQTWNVAQYQFDVDGGAGAGAGCSTKNEVDLEKLTIATSRSTSSTASSSFPVGGVQMGCTFVKNGTIPVCVGYNGQIVQLLPSDAVGIVANSHRCHLIATGHCAPISASCTSMVMSSTTPTSGIKMYTGDTDGVLCQWDISSSSSSSTVNTASTSALTIKPVRRIIPINNADLLYATHHGAISGTTVLYPSKNSTSNNSHPILLSVGWDDRLYVSINERVKYSQAIGSQPTTISSGGTGVACLVTVKGLLLVIASSNSNETVPITVSAIITIPYVAQAAIISSDDTTLYVGGIDCKIYIYSISGMEITLQHTIEDGHYKPIYCLSISNDGKKLASGDDRDVCIWDISSSIPTALIGRGKWCFHTQRITSIGWSMDDRIVISGGADDSIYVWRIEKKMTRIHYNYTHRGGVFAIHCIPSSSNQCHFISCGVDAVVNLWDITTDVEKKFGF